MAVPTNPGGRHSSRSVSSSLLKEAEYNLFTDYNQFVVFDSLAEWGNDLWTDQELEDMFIQGDGYITVGTKRRFYASVTVRVLEGDAPTVKADKTQRGSLFHPQWSA